MLSFIDQPTRYLFFTGKGGVGKTSLATATAVALADQGRRVLLVSTDPASNLGQVLECEVAREVTPVETVPGLFTLDIDPEAAAEAYRKRVLDPVRERLSDTEVRRVEEQLSGACTTEIASFDEFTQLLTHPGHQGRFDHIVFDTAPTGHTLLLLDQTGAYHREVRRHTQGMGGKVTTPLMRLQDPDYTRLLVVTLPETTPVLEAARLQSDLRRTQIEPYAWVVNQSLAAGDPSDPLLVERAHAEADQMEAVRTRHARRMFVAPWTTYEPRGSEALAAFIRGKAVLPAAAVT